jgi:hypothetical protein
LPAFGGTTRSTGCPGRGGGEGKPIRFLLACLAWIAGGAFAFAAGEKPAVVEQEPWSNVFAGKEAVFHFLVTSSETFRGTAGWSLSSSGRVLARREHAVTAGPGAAATVETRFECPTVKEGVVWQAVLSVSLMAEGSQEAVARAEKTLWVFPEDPFADRKEWLKKLNLHLFDPAKKTATVLEKAGVPFRAVANVDGLDTLRDVVVVVGEGISLRDYRGLAQALVRTAAAGTPVLCMALSDGEMTLAGMGSTDLPQPERMIFRRGDVIRELDKRLDAVAWPPDGRAAANGIKIRGERGPVVGEAAKGSDGWPWIEMSFSDGKKKGHIVFCGFAIVEKWESGPTPRFLLRNVLEHVTKAADWRP